jgi:cytochrome P450
LQVALNLILTLFSVPTIQGHDTTATTLSWAVKFLTNNQEAQKKLQEELHQTFPECTPNSPPTVHGILSADIPYLDACLEEVQRVANIVPRLVRIATVDTEVLGYHIPKGAHVMCNTYVAEPPFEIPESIRSKKSQESRGTVRSVWHRDNMQDFYPERWLDKRGKFDGNALPKLAFSSGPRACFGR